MRKASNHVAAGVVAAGGIGAHVDEILGQREELRRRVLERRVLAKIARGVADGPVDSIWPPASRTNFRNSR